jgi:branched-chain amino acid transport system substrate-binding protein
LTIGVLTDLTGAAAGGDSPSVQGIKAGVYEAKKDGYTINYVVADTQTSVSGALAAAQQLVRLDHVFAVIAVSALTFAAAPYLTSQNIAVIGASTDGPEWLTSKNMFNPDGYTDNTKIATTVGQLLKNEGATSVASIGYGIGNSAAAAKGWGASAKSVGLTVGYLNDNLSFGTTNMEPVALAMHNAGVNALESALATNSDLALVVDMRQQGVQLKAVMLPAGYGEDLDQAGPAAQQDAQNVIFQLNFEPIEMHTKATEQFTGDLAAAGIHEEPDYAAYEGYTSMAMLVAGLQAAGSDPTSAGLISSLNAMKSFDAWGLLGSHPFNPSVRVGTSYGVDYCEYYAQWSGSAFHLVQGADPLCGTPVSGS